MTKSPHNGPVIIGLASTTLSAVEKAMLDHPQVGGVILFSRNYTAPQQLIHLIKTIKKQRPKLFIAVDQEGGRVQRFNTGLQKLSSLGTLGQAYQTQGKTIALALASRHANTLTKELKGLGITLSFTPVLDLDRGHSQIIGDRAFHGDPEIVSILSQHYVKCLLANAFPAVGKHFPGHGYVTEDSHLALPVDHRDYADIASTDLKPFVANAHHLTGMMTAHICFPKVDPHPVTFSSYWLKTILRDRLNFKGIIFSDDLMMAGAINYLPEIEARAELALFSGCDKILVCNNIDAQQRTLDHLTRLHYVNTTE